jgi:signal transduction histidine kinase
MQLHIRRTSLVAVIEATIRVMLPAALAKEVEIAPTFDRRADWIPGDPDRLQQVLWNLLTNAVKFAPPGSRIDVTLELDGTYAVIQVRDRGIGISPDFLPHVFDRFRQADPGLTRKHGGLGIGLAIVRHVVEMHGGSVCAKSDGPGLGTTFAVSLPVAADLRPVPAEVSDSNSNGDGDHCHPSSEQLVHAFDGDAS